jgi:GNAT superfamily N-acetyltransferase
MSTLEVVLADLSRDDHAAAVLALVDAYARDPMGDGAPLADDVRARLIDGLRAHPTSLVFLAYREAEAIGVAVCFRGFSTFRAEPLVNLHDLAVLPGHRGHGVGRRLLEAVEQRARELGCCRLTLEVQDGNHRARGIYAAAGFEQATYRPEAGRALFLVKPLAALPRGNP